MPTSFAIRLLSGALLGLANLPALADGPFVDELRPGDHVTLELASGRRFKMTLDRRTDEHTLWVRSDLTSGNVLRPIPWPRLVQVEFAGQTISGGQLLDAVRAWPHAPSADERMIPPGPDRTLGTLAAPLTGPTTVTTSPGVHVPPIMTSARGPRIRSLDVDAWASNWDSDVEVDGLLVDVYPLDSAGQLMPARGLVEVHLITERVGVTTPRDPFVREARWVKPVRIEDFSAGGATVKLAYQGFHPEFDTHRAPYGAVHVRLSVPGHGVFEATRSVVRLRPYSATRDRYQQRTGRRFFDIERTGRGQR
jgi:hypothetical protein